MSDQEAPPSQPLAMRTIKKVPLSFERENSIRIPIYENQSNNPIPLSVAMTMTDKKAIVHVPRIPTRLPHVFLSVPHERFALVPKQTVTVIIWCIKNDGEIPSNVAFLGTIHDKGEDYHFFA